MSKDIYLSLHYYLFFFFFIFDILHLFPQKHMQNSKIYYRHQNNSSVLRRTGKNGHDPPHLAVCQVTSSLSNCHHYYYQEKSTGGM